MIAVEYPFNSYFKNKHPHTTMFPIILALATGSRRTDKQMALKETIQGRPNENRNNRKADETFERNITIIQKSQKCPKSSAFSLRIRHTLQFMLSSVHFIHNSHWEFVESSLV